MAITALRDYPDMKDRSRYSNAYDLHRNGQWEHVVLAARLHSWAAKRSDNVGPEEPRIPQQLE